MTLNKTDIIEKISEADILKPAQAKETIETLLEIIKSTLTAGQEVMITGFGKFQINDKTARKGRNPATGDEMILDKRRVVTFKCSGKLRDAMNGTGD
ncbi:MAG: integration host factor subunit alpha [Pseudomonadota bacterium]